MRHRILLCVICLLTGCSVSIKQPPPIPAEYRTACQRPGKLVDGRHYTVEVWAINTASDAIACAVRMDYLLEAIKRREEMGK